MSDQSLALIPVRREMIMPLVDIQTMAKTVAASRLFAIQSEQQALALMLVCQSEGLHPMQAVKRYHIIQGRPSMRADAMQAEFQTRGGKVQWIERSDSAAEAEFSHPSGGTLKVRWTIQEARNAGLATKDIWKQYPRQMLSARVVSEGVRAVLPEVVAGIFTPEEVQDFDAKLPAAADEEIVQREEAREKAAREVAGATVEPKDGYAGTTFVPTPTQHWTQMTRSEADAWQTVIHFGKNKGKTLQSLSESQRAWYFDEWFKQKKAPGATVTDQDEHLLIALNTLAPLPCDRDIPGVTAAATPSWRDEMTPLKIRLGDMSMVKLVEMARFIGSLKGATARQRFLRETVLTTALPELIANATREDVHPVLDMLDAVDQEENGRPLDKQEQQIFDLAFARYQALSPVLEPAAA